VRKRLLIYELAEYIYDLRTNDPNPPEMTVAKEEVFKFLLNWLKGNPRVFLYDDKLRRADAFDRNRLLSISDPVLRSKYERARTFHYDGMTDMFVCEEYYWGLESSSESYKLQMLDSPLSASMFLRYLNRHPWENSQIGEMITDAGLSKVDDLSVWIAESLSIEDLSEKQWGIVFRSSMTLELGIRYCIEYYGQLPYMVRSFYESEYAYIGSRGRRFDEQLNKEKCIEYLNWLIDFGFHELRHGGIPEACKLIIKLWDVDRNPNSVRDVIATHYNELLKKKNLAPN